MMAHSHVLFGACGWWAWCLYSGDPVTATDTAVAMLGGLLPDIDHPQSTLGRRIPFISIPIAKVFGHRGITHSLLAVIGVAALLMFYGVPLIGMGAAGILAPVCIGYLSHLVGDMLTPSGVPLLWPVKKNYSIGLFRTGSPVETVVVTALTMALFTTTGIAPGLTDVAQAEMRQMIQWLPALARS